MSEPKQPRRTGSRWVITTAVLLGLFVLWPLSVGPFIWLEANNLLDPVAAEWLQTIYLPWEWLYHRSGVVRAFFDWYIALWVPIFP